jgi:N-acyl-D-aspartate/D-glutamate deacylase
VGDVAVDGGKITAVGVVAARGREEIDATGKIVTPGFVDLHTHYDGQATWDPWVTPSGWHGVTTVVMGNCGVGFAPCRPEDRDWLIGVMEGVEDIPGTALVEGIRWDWQTFPEYLDALERFPRAVDVAALVPHAPIRGWVMGRRAAEGGAATPDEVAEMRRLVADGLRAGGVGFSTSRTQLHKTAEGVLVAGTHAELDELDAIADAFAEVGHGVLSVADEHALLPADLDRFEQIARRTGFPVSVNLAQIDPAPELWKQTAERLERTFAEGVPLRCQVPGRAIGILMSWRGTAHPFALCESWVALSMHTWEQQLEHLKDPAFRAKLCAETPFFVGEFQQFVTRTWDKMFPVDGTFDYEPPPSASLGQRAAGRNPAELAYDALMEGDGTGLLYFPLFNYSDGNLDMLHRMHTHPASLMGLSDGGAHCGAIADAGMPTFMLSFWARDRSRGPKLPLEYVVRRQTHDTAAFYGLRDRGLVQPGLKADLNVIDLDALGVDRAEMAWDLPAGGRRLVQKGRGYAATIVSGEVIARDGVFTGAMPGGVGRGGR